MSKGSLFWANASGKLGESVFYRSGGEQRNRTYVKNIKNPKTKSQMINRIQMANLAAVFRNYRSVLDFSFTEKKSNQSSWNAFVAANKKVNGAVCPKLAIEEGGCVPVGMVMAQGSLVVPSPTIIESTETGSYYGFETNLSYGDSVDENAAYKALLDKLGLPSNTKMAVLKARYNDEYYKSGWYVYQADSGIVASNNGGVGFIIEQSVNGKTLISLNVMDEETEVAVIFSYTDANGKTIVSNAAMHPASEDAVSEYAEQFLGPNGDVYQQVLDTYGYNNSSVLATR